MIQLATDYDIIKEQYEDMSNKKSENEHQKDSIVYSIQTVSDFDIGSGVCTLKGCVMGANKFMLNCYKCKRLTHYACMKLPAYQISLFLLKGYRIYQCRVCVGKIHKDILDNCHTDSNMRDLKDLKVKCQKLEDEIKEKSNTIAATKEVEERNINNTEEDVSRSVEYLSKSIQVSNTSYTENTENKLDKDTDSINMSSNNLSNDIQMLVNRRFDKIEENIDRIILRKLEEKCSSQLQPN